MTDIYSPTISGGSTYSLTASTASRSTSPEEDFSKNLKNSTNSLNSLGESKSDINDENQQEEDDKEAYFKLDPTFVAQYAQKVAPFGFNGLGYLVYIRTYSRKKMVNGKETNEEWFETIERVVNGNFTLRKQWSKSQNINFNEREQQKLAQRMYDKMFNLKFFPGGRGLQHGGSDVINKKKLYAALYNCAFITTQNIGNEFVDTEFEDPATEPFTWCMDASLLGIGVGFDVRGADKLFIPGVNKNLDTETFVVPDSREGWALALKAQLSSFIRHKAPVEFDFSEVRPEGAIIKTFGGIASGPGPLQKLLDFVHTVLSKRSGSKMTITDIIDIFNNIGVCVVSGGIRRTALLCLGDAESDEYLDLKNYNKNPQRTWGWTSNNSVFATVGMDYENACERVKINGEPGFVFLENVRKHGRMNGKDATWRDRRVLGLNPCNEAQLEDFELCNLTETFLNRHDNLEEFLETLQFAFLYSKVTTLAPTQWKKVNEVILRNRRIGTGITGGAQFEAKFTRDVLKEWLNKGYDTIKKFDVGLSEELCIRESIKLTCVKPSGTVSLLSGSSPGIHCIESRFYIRRVRLQNTSPLIHPLKLAGYFLEPSKTEPNSIIVEIPVDGGEGIKTLNEISMWEQMETAAFWQEHWADQSVSVTITFDPETEGHLLPKALRHFETRLKCVSFLPRTKQGCMVYVQPPYQPISQEEYEIKFSKLKPLNFNQVNLAQTDETPIKFCDGENCTISN